MTAGRPPAFKTVEELETAIEEYFTARKLADEPPTVSGLALFLGFADRQSMYDYKERPEYSCTVKKAITKMEDFAEVKLLKGEGQATGPIFWLKNHGWKDKTETDVNVQNYSLFEEAVEEKAKKYETKQRGKEKAKD